VVELEIECPRRQSSKHRRRPGESGKCFRCNLYLRFMYEQPLPDFTSPDWCGALYRYAKQLSDAYSANLARLSGTGIELEAENRIALTINPFQGENAFDDRRNPQRNRGSVMHELQSAMIDAEFFEKWHKDAKPLLVLAPFGCGKSILLADFTCRFAKRLMDWCKKPNGLPPWVPFPVRLRGWQRDTLEQYIEGDAQSHVNRTGGQSWLSAKRIRHLRNARRLLPLFDGFDELSYMVNADGHRSNAISDIWLMYPDHHVLSSRPGNGAEESKYQSRGTVHQLRDLDERVARQFIVQRLNIAVGDMDDPTLVQYRAAQPHINDLFRRPLFLAAWCARAKQSLRNLPTTISGLMDVVLGHVLDQRIADNRKVDYRTLHSNLLQNRHYLGAILAIHADAGFNVVVTSSEIAAAVRKHPWVLTDKSAKRFIGYLLKAGLLLEHNDGTYTEKIPIVEYLIGYYYAWLAEKQTGESMEAHQRQMVTAFQRRLWWRDHDEVWLYAFDIMWRGCKSQQELAGDLVRWVLRLSRECNNAGIWDAPLANGYEEDDRQPYSFHQFVLCFLLPVGGNGFDGDAALSELVGIAIDQLKDEHKLIWKRLGKPGHSLVQLAQRRPRLTVDWLMASLHDAEYRQGWDWIASSVEDVSEHLGKDDVSKLLGYLKDAEHKQEWKSIVSAAGKTSARLGGDSVAELLYFLQNPEYELLWDRITSAVGMESSGLGKDVLVELLRCLNDLAYEQAWSSVASAVGQVRAGLSKADVTNLLCFLKNAKYHQEWDSIAKTVGTSAHLGRDVVDELLRCLTDIDYKQAWPSIASAIVEASAQLDQRDVAQLVMYLRNTEYTQSWKWIAWAVVNASTYLGKDDVAELVCCLKDAEHHQAWDWIAFAVGKASAHLGRDAVDELLRCLTDPEYKKAWSSIDYAERHAWAYLCNGDTAELMPFLNDPAYKQAWPSIASAVCEAPIHLGQDEIAELLKCLRDPAYQRSWSSIASAVGKSSAHLGRDVVTELLRCLANPQCEQGWSSIASAVGESSAFLERDDITTLLRCMKNPKYERAWSRLAWTVSKGSRHLRKEDVTELLQHLNDPTYTHEWMPIAVAIANATTYLERDNVTELLRYLNDSKYEEAWDSIALTLGKASSHLTTEDTSKLLGYLKDATSDRVKSSIAFAVGKASLHMGKQSVPALLRYLEDAKYKEIWRWIASALGEASALLGKEDVGKLLQYLNDVEYRLAWSSISSAVGNVIQESEMTEWAKKPADDAARDGRISYARRIAATIPRRICFVRDVNPKAKLGQRIIYGVAERYDGDLLLNPKFAEENIKRLLVGDQSQSPPTGQRATLKGRELSSKLVIAEIKLGMEACLPDKADAFDDKWQGLSRTTKDRRLFEIIRLMLRDIPRDQRVNFCWKGNRRGIDAVQDSLRSIGQKSLKHEDTAKGKQLRVNSMMLIALRDGEGGCRLMSEIYKLVLEERPLDDSWKDLKDPAFICPNCGRIYLVPDPSEGEEPKPPPSCEVCNRPFDLTRGDKPENMPLEVKQCPCDEDRNFAISPAKGRWKYSPRDLFPQHCPCKECKSKKKWWRSKTGE
jgi:hypothetical protein